MPLSKGRPYYAIVKIQLQLFFPELLNGIQPIIIESIDPNVEYDQSA